MNALRLCDDKRRRRHSMSSKIKKHLPLHCCKRTDTITKEANITGLVRHVSLTDNANIWKNNILKNCTYKREDTSEIFKEKGYDINDVSNEFINIIFNDRL